MKARYNATDNTLTELSDFSPPPDRPNIKLYSSSQKEMYQRHLEAWHIVMQDYNRGKAEHEKLLRTIPCHESCKGVFIHDCDYEEGRDYKVYQYEDRLTLAYPIEKDGEDEALIHYEYAGKLAYCLGITINGRDWEEKALPELKKHYTITPR